MAGIPGIKLSGYVWKNKNKLDDNFAHEKVKELNKMNSIIFNESSNTTVLQQQMHVFFPMYNHQENLASQSIKAIWAL